MPSISQSMSARVFFVIGTVTAIIAGLYFAQPVLIPLTVSALLAFLLTPIVQWLQKKGLPRLIAVIVLVTVACTALGGLGYIVADQLVGMTDDLPRYEHNLKQRIYSLQGQSAGFEKFAETAEDLKKATEEAAKGDGAGDTARADAAEGSENEASEQSEKPVPVKVTTSPSIVSQIGTYLAPAINPVTTFGLIVLLTLFMLLQPLHIGERLGWLMGAGHVEVTRSMLDEAGSRISSYLLMQLLLSAVFGTAAGIGLWLFGLPGALLWGLVAGLARFIPYVGPWIGDGLPILISLAVFPNWAQPLGIAAMFIVFELISNNILEPWLYGASTGLSPLAVLLAMVFWGWLWGAIGLLLAVPMTVCLVVAGKYIPGVRVFTVMLGDRQTVQPHVMFYYMLTAGQIDEASDTLQEHTRRYGAVSALDEYWLPAVVLAGEEHSKSHIDDDQLARLIADAEDLADHALNNSDNTVMTAAEGTHLAVQCLSVGTRVDDLAAKIAIRLLSTAGSISARGEDGEAGGGQSKCELDAAVLIRISTAASDHRTGRARGRRCVTLASPLNVKRQGPWQRWWRRADCSPQADIVCTFADLIDRLDQYRAQGRAWPTAA